MYYSGLSNNYCIMPTSAIINPLFGYHGNGYVIALNGGITTGNEFLSLGSTPDLQFQLGYILQVQLVVLSL